MSVKESMGSRRKEGVESDLGIRVSGKTLMWGPYVVGYIVWARGSAIKAVYVCPVCGAMYSHARNWRYHMRVKHPDFLKKMEELSYEMLKSYRAKIKRLSKDDKRVWVEEDIGDI